MKSIRITSVLLFSAILLSACLPAATPASEPTPLPTSTPPEALPPAWENALNAASQNLASMLGVVRENITFVSAEARNWPDSCLGLPMPEEMCAAAITPGYLIILKYAEKTYLFHTDQGGTSLRIEPDPAAPRSYPPAVEAARVEAAVRAGIAPDDVKVVDFTAENWRDSCLGVAAPNAMCLQVITPGFRVIFEAAGNQVEYHTDETGTVIRLAGESAPNIGVEVIRYRQEGETCLEARVSSEAMIAAGPCSGIQAVQGLRPELAEQLNDWILSFSGFSASRAGRDLTFTGNGTHSPTDAEQRSLVEWARAAALEAAGGLDGTTGGIVLTWSRSGGIAGFCDELSVYLYGDYYASSCKNSSGTYGRMHLTADQLAWLYNLVDTLAPFEINSTDPATADAMTIRLNFNSTGEQAASEADKAAIQSFSAELYAAAVTPPTAEETSKAREALTNYFKLLNQKDYAAAALLYGGSTSSLTGMNPDLDPSDLPGLMEAGCSQNGLTCLAVRTVSDPQVISRERMVFKVEFSTPEGELFVLGPCCGASETEMPPISSFDYTVRLVDGRYLVMELPVYVP